MKRPVDNRASLKIILATSTVLLILLLPGVRASEDVTVEEVYPEDGATDLELGPENEVELRVQVNNPEDEDLIVAFHKTDHGSPEEIIGDQRIKGSDIATVIWEDLEHEKTYEWGARIVGRTSPWGMDTWSFTTEEEPYEGIPWLWIALGVVIVLSIIGVVMLAKGRGKERERTERMGRRPVDRRRARAEIPELAGIPILILLLFLAGNVSGSPVDSVQSISYYTENDFSEGSMDYITTGGGSKGYIKVEEGQNWGKWSIDKEFDSDVDGVVIEEFVVWASDTDGGGITAWVHGDEEEVLKLDDIEDGENHETGIGEEAEENLNIWVDITADDGEVGPLVHGIELGYEGEHTCKVDLEEVVIEGPDDEEEDFDGDEFEVDESPDCEREEDVEDIDKTTVWNYTNDFCPFGGGTYTSDITVESPTLNKKYTGTGLEYDCLYELSVEVNSEEDEDYVLVEWNGENKEVENEATILFDGGVEVDLTAKPSEYQVFEGWIGDVPGDEEEEEITLIMDKERDVIADFGLGKGSISGTVETVDEGQTVNEEVNINITAENGESYDTTIEMEIGDESKGYEINDLPAGKTYTVSAEVIGESNWEIINGEEDVTVGAGEKETVDFELKPKEGSISGTVKTVQEGQTVDEDVEVTLSANGEDEEITVTGGEENEGYEIDDLPADRTYTVSAEVTSESVWKIVDSQRSVYVEPGKDVEEIDFELSEDICDYVLRVLGPYGTWDTKTVRMPC